MKNSQPVDSVKVETRSTSVIQDYSRNGYSNWVTILVSMEQPPNEALAGLDRSQRHDLLCDNAKQRYLAIIDWIDAQDLENEFKRIGSPTLFSTITMVCTPLAAKLIRKAPGVTDVVDGSSLVLNGH